MPSDSLLNVTLIAGVITAAYDHRTVGLFNTTTQTAPRRFLGGLPPRSGTELRPVPADIDIKMFNLFIQSTPTHNDWLIKCCSVILNLYSESDSFPLLFQLNAARPLRAGPSGCFASEIICVTGFLSLPVNPSSSLLLTDKDKDRPLCLIVAGSAPVSCYSLTLSVPSAE